MANPASPMAFPILFPALLLAFTACYPPTPQSSHSDRVDNAVYTRLLQRHVNTQGWVDYPGLLKEKDSLRMYLKTLGAHVPSPDWPEEEKLAYWINVYNAFTLDLVLQHYPVKSIKDIGPSPSIPKINTPWKIKFIRLGNNTYCLDDIEHGILRKDFREPRIHFTLVCASRSCPPLLREAYSGDKLEVQLDRQTRDFLNDPRRNVITPTHLKLSRIFQWYGSDFSQQGDILDFIRIYAGHNFSDNPTVEFLEYDWALNGQGR